MFPRRRLPWLVAAVLGAATITAAVQGAESDRETARVAREHALEITTQAAAALSSGLEARVSDVAGLFNASQAVSAEEFSAFTDPMLADSKATSLSFVELTSGGRRAVVRYIETPDENTAQLGEDALASKVDADAIAAAERTRTPQSTVPFLLDGKADPGVRLYVPVYGPNAGPTATQLLAAAKPSSIDLNAVVNFALSFQGVRYQYGGATPAGFDCSGFVMYVYAKFGVALPHSAIGQGAAGVPISRAQARPGDLVFFNDGSHDGFFMGGNNILDAPEPGGVVGVRPLWTSAVHFVRVG